MISTDKLALAFGGRTLFEGVTLKFVPGNCYGLIGANGAGKSTFLRCLAGDQEPSNGSVIVPPHQRVHIEELSHEIDECCDGLLIGGRRLRQDLDGDQAA